MKKIQLTQGHFTLIDDEDYDFLMQWKWCYSGHGYAMRSELISRINGKRKQNQIYMHRIINKTPRGAITDHIDGDGLNNHNRLLIRQWRIF